MSSLRKGLLSLAEYVFCYFLFMFMEIGIHEYCHLWALVSLGGKGYIEITWFGAQCVITRVPPQWYGPTLVALAGGIGVFLLYSIIVYWDWIDEDYEEMAACLPMWLKNLVYGLFEGFMLWRMPSEEFLKWALIICGVSFVAGIFISITTWVKFSLLRIIE